MPRTLRLSWPLLAVLLATLCVAGPAAADYRDVYDECENGVLTSQYSAKDLKLAAQRMSAYQRDYTNCSDAIAQAQTGSKKSKSGSGSGSGSDASGGATGAGAGAGTGGTGASGSATDGGATSGGGAKPGGTPLTPDEKYIATQAAIQQADAQGSIEQLLAAAKVPAASLTYSSTGGSIPLPLVIALAVSAALALLAAVMSLLARLRRPRVD